MSSQQPSMVGSYGITFPAVTSRSTTTDVLYQTDGMGLVVSAVQVVSAANSVAMLQGVPSVQDAVAVDNVATSGPTIPAIIQTTPAAYGVPAVVTAGVVPVQRSTYGAVSAAIPSVVSATVSSAQPGVSAAVSAAVQGLSLIHI